MQRRLIYTEVGTITDDNCCPQIVMLIQPLSQARALKGIERVFRDNLKAVRERETRQFRNGGRLARIHLTMRREVGKLNRVRRMAILRQDEVPHANSICHLKGIHDRLNNVLYPRARQHAFSTKPVNHIDAEQRNMPLLRVRPQFAPR